MIHTLQEQLRTLLAAPAATAPPVAAAATPSDPTPMPPTPIAMPAAQPRQTVPTVQPPATAPPITTETAVTPPPPPLTPEATGTNSSVAQAGLCKICQQPNDEASEVEALECGCVCHTYCLKQWMESRGITDRRVACVLQFHNSTELRTGHAREAGAAAVEEVANEELVMV